MSRIFFLCPLVEYPRAPMWAPRIVPIQAGPTGHFPARWTTTDAIRQESWALGVAEVNTDQAAAIAADPQIYTFDGVGERFVQFRDLPAQRRNAINQYLQRIGQPQATNTEVLDDLMDRVIRANEPLKNLQSLFDELDNDLGVIG